MNHILSCVLAIVTWAAVIFAAHPNTEHDTMNFYYDPEGQYLVARTASVCYLAKLTTQEQDHVHTNRGMEDLEMAMMRDMFGQLNETRVYHHGSLPTNIQHWCSDRDLYLLERGIEVMSTSTSLIG